MRRAERGWVMVLLILQLSLAGCRLLGDLTTPSAGTTGTPTGTPQPSVAPDPPLGEQPTDSAPDGQKPPKPRSTTSTADVVPGKATATAELRPTPDPALDTWTVLVFMSGGAGLDAAALHALNEMEAADPGEHVNVLVQLDRNLPADSVEEWQGARRYRIAAGADPANVESELLQDLGPTNMGDPDSLSDFLTWAQEAYPANRYALILWGDSKGWRGLLQDSGDGDDLSISDLGGALQRALSQNERARLDLIAFDAALTAHLELLTAVQSHADYAVAAPGLLPLHHWNYTTLLQALYDDEQMMAEELAQHMVTSDEPSLPPGSTVTGGMTAVDLGRLPAVNTALQELAQAILESADLYTAAVAGARRSAQITTLAIEGRSDPFAAVDLSQFGAQLAQLAPLPHLTRRSLALVDAVSMAVISAEGSGAEQADSGLTVAFLPLQEVDDPVYRAADVAVWQQALRAFYEASTELAHSPQGQVAVLAAESAGAQQPVLLGLELRAMNLDGAALVALRQEPDQGRRLLFLDSLRSNTSLDAPSPHWPDGLYQQELIWDTTAAYVSDGANGDFAPLWPLPADPGLYVAPGKFLPGAEAGSDREAILLFDRVSRELNSVWQSGDSAVAPRQLLPSPGDGFQLNNVYMDAGNAISFRPGVTLVFSDETEISYDYFPLPSGEYQVGLLARAPTDSSLVASGDLAVANEGLTPGYQAYVNAQYGFQFLYPLAWPEPVFDGRRVTTAARERGATLTVSIYPQSGGATAAQLKTQTLETFGELDVLYEEAVLVGGEEGMLTAYGYNAEDGPHTGVFVAFVDSDRDVGYVADVDGLALDEATTIEIANRLVQSWTFRTLRSGSWPEQWVTTTINPLSITLPQTYIHESLGNGWQLFKDGAAFLAARSDPISGEGRAAIAAHWAEVASRGVDNYASDDQGSLTLAGTVWSRVEFGYEGDDGRVSGIILATIHGGREVVAWAEGPADAFDQLLNDTFLMAIAGALPDAPGTALVLYASTFDSADSWGVGRQDSATGSVTDGVYELAVDAPRAFFSTSAGVTLSDGLFEVEVTQRSGSLDSGYGLLLRADVSEQSFYLLEISGDGYVWIGWCSRNCAEATSLVGDGWFASDAVKQGLGVSNTLRVEAEGQQLIFFVNDSQVGTVENDAAGSGDVGLFAETLGEGDLVVQFDNLSVLAP